MTAAARLLLAAVLVSAPNAALAEDGIRSIEDGLPPRAVERLRARIDERLRWIHALMKTLRLDYEMPSVRPEMHLVSRAWVLAHEREVCFSSASAEEIRACSSRVFGWIDDDRRIYVVRGEDVPSTEGLPPMRDFPVELWVEMTWTHELVHFIQLERSEWKPTTLPCDTLYKWEHEAFLIAAQWLHSLQNADAERINAVFRGQLPRARCS
ncbi:MAG: hypothetical protein HY078_11650 [Elusimicrobia bacterium]|nr:hypothetical protein [Elusimicrobiota bacterium]